MGVLGSMIEENTRSNCYEYELRDDLFLLVGDLQETADVPRIMEPWLRL